MNVQEIYTKLKENICKTIIGKEEIADKIVICMLCGGHILLEDIPGTGKTTLAKTLARSVDGDFKRMQFTADLLPSELTGIRYFDQKQSEFVFSKGPVFTNILLADEINRATPRTQSSLLECMEEKQVSDHGTTYELEKLFLVIATQNPVETQGTFPLPEAQLDRFFMKLSMGYPDRESEINILKRYEDKNPLENISPVVTKEDIIKAQSEIKQIKISDDIAGYITDIVSLTRNTKEIKLGVSPRGTIAFMNAAKGNAGINGRDYVTPDDVKAVACDVISHRIILNGFFTDKTNENRNITEKLISQVPVPSERIF